MYSILCIFHQKNIQFFDLFHLLYLFDYNIFFLLVSKSFPYKLSKHKSREWD
uniref:Uncharacterized protein n=1 Tax=Siphoviridae sp. ct5jB2 TaxID=2825337 RepID=A0A8S5TTJ6_9CAUD|nr:MAG TPA: hypothetical protein [Siphoviridae sp. ct5jB2]